MIERNVIRSRGRFDPLAPVFDRLRTYSEIVHAPHNIQVSKEQEIIATLPTVYYWGLFFAQVSSCLRFADGYPVTDSELVKTIDRLARPGAQKFVKYEIEGIEDVSIVFPSPYYLLNGHSVNKLPEALVSYMGDIGYSPRLFHYDFKYISTHNLQRVIYGIVSQQKLAEEGIRLSLLTSNNG